MAQPVRVGIHGINWVRRPRLLRTPHLLPRVPGPFGALVMLFSAMLWLCLAMVVATFYLLVISAQLAGWLVARGGPWLAAQRGRRQLQARSNASSRTATPTAHRPVLERDGFRCHWCGNPNNLVVTRAYPGGTDEPGNLQTLCSPCATYKGNAVMDNPWLPPYQPWSTPA